MPVLPVTFEAFPEFPSSRRLRVRTADLVYAALVMGKPPLDVRRSGKTLIARPQRRAYLDLIWRVVTVTTHLRARGGCWVRSSSYDALDPSEKSGVSYLLGGTQAKLTSAALLGYPYLVHVDSLLAALDEPISKSRPDYIACDAHGFLQPAAIEAKGRSGGYEASRPARAKAQATLVPAILNLPAPRAIGSIAWFDDSVWKSHLIDPPARRQQELDLAAVVTYYYLPIAAAIDQAGDSDGATAAFPEIDLTVALPRPIADAMAPLLDGTPFGEAYHVAFEQILAYLQSDDVSDSERRQSNSSFALGRSSIGLDLVSVSLGPTWSDEPADPEPGSDDLEDN